MKIFFGGILALLATFVFACEVGEIENQAYQWTTEIPSTVPPMLIPADNPLSVAGVTLGRMLFYDPVLSLDSTQSCASCHRQELAFTDGKARSTGVLGLKGERNAMSLVNIGFFHKGLFWDGRSPTLEEQSLHPITENKELAANWPLLLKRLRHHEEYPKQFKLAFGLSNIKNIDSSHVAKALAQFERTIISFDAKFDQVMRGDADFTVNELRGWTIFFDASLELPHAECSHCHTDPLFTNLEFHNNGIEQVASLNDFNDLGRGMVTGNFYDNGKFKVPSLRNIMLTAPYMHRGQLNTLTEVLDHYNSGGHFSENVSPNVRPLDLTDQDKADIISFLNTLTDSVLINKPELSNPF